MARQHRLYIWVPALVVAFALGLLIGHRRWNRDFSDFPPLFERSSHDMVYAIMSAPTSNLFHFSDCQYFSEKMRAIGSADAVYTKGTFKPCPKCTVVTQDNDGKIKFWAWRKTGKDAPTWVMTAPDPTSTKP